MPPNRPTFPITWGGGLDRATGIAAVRPSDFADIRNMDLFAGKAQTRRGMSRTASLLLGGAGAAMNDVIFNVPIRATREGAVLAWKSGTGEVQLFTTDAQGTTPVYRFLWFTDATAGRRYAHAAEVYRKVFFAQDLASTVTRAATQVYDVDAHTVANLTGDLDGAGVVPIYFRGVARHLGYLVGWGYGSASEADRPEVVRISLPGQPTVFNREHYFLVGARGDPVVLCIPTRNELLVFKETEFYAVVGTGRANFGVWPRDTEYGLAAPKLAVSVNGTVYFWSVEGPRMTEGGVSVDLSVPLDLGAPEPSDLVAAGLTVEGFAVWSSATRQVRFHFGKRCYVLHLRDPGNPRWTYSERGRSLNCGGPYYGSGDTPASSRLQLFYGQDSGNGLFKDNSGFQDDGINYQARATSDPVAPAGPDGECSFYTLWLAATHTMAVTLRVTPIVDGVAGATVDLTLTTKATRTTEVFEVGLKLATGSTVLTAPRGTWFQAKVETLVGGVAAIATGDLLFDLSSLEYSIERETRQAS